MAKKESASPPSESATPPASAVELIGPMKRIEVGSVNYAYHTFGSGKPLLMIMGFTGTMSIWDTRLLRDLASSYQVTIFDNRGIGYSTDTATGPLTMESMADSTVELIAALGLKKPDVVGWSMGGEIALAMAVRNGDKLGKVIAVSADAGSPNTVYAADDIDRELSDPSLTFEKLMELLFPPDQQDVKNKYLASLKDVPQPDPNPTGVRRQAAAEDAYATTTSTWDGLGKIKNPVMLMTGDQDKVVPGENSVRMAGLIPGAWLAQFPGAGHAVLFQYPEKCASTIRAFLG